MQANLNPPFFISMWCGPSREHITVEDYRLVAECGFNVVFPPCEGGWGCDVALNRKILDTCRQVGLKAVISDSRIVDRNSGCFPLKPDTADFTQAIDAVVADYSGHPALAGYYIEDEPDARRFGTLAAVLRRFEEKDPRHFAYINLNPDCGPDGHGSQTYPQYVTTFIESVKPPFVSWDNYQAMRPEHMGAEGCPQFFISNLETVRRASLTADLPFMQIVLLTPHGDYRDPDAADLRWQVFTTLAYGAHGIMYFTYWPVIGPGIVNDQGQPGPKYPVVREINLRLQALAPTLVRLKSAGVYHTEPLPPGNTRTLSPESPVRKMEGGHMVLGWLKDNAGSDFIFVVNRGRKDKIDAQLILADRVLKAEEISQLTGKPQPAAFDDGTHRLTTKLEAGEGKLFQLENRRE